MGGDSKIRAVQAVSARSLILMFIVLVAVFAPAFFNAALIDVDYRQHMAFALDLKATGDFTVLPHWVYYVLVIAFSELLPNAHPYIHGGLAVLLPYIALGMIVFVLLCRALATATSRHTILAGCLTLILLMITPIFILISLDTELPWTYLLGYVNPTPYYNPTQNVLKLWLIPVSLIALRAVNPLPYTRRYQRTGYIILSAVLVILMTFTKPNYTLCLLPGLGLYALYRMVTRKQLDWTLLILGIGVPAVGVLAVQYFNTFGTEQDASVAFGLFKVVNTWEIPVWQLPTRLLLSIAFPLAVYGLHFRHARQDNYLNLTWLIFFFGLFYMYTLYETGSRETHGNFIWGAFAALFVVMYASVVFLIRIYKNRLSGFRRFFRLPRRLQIVSAICVLHMIFGLTMWVIYAIIYQYSIE